MGTVQPVVTATVRTQLAGSLFKLFFRDGQMVRQGQVLAQIDPRPYQLALAQSKATLARDQAQLKGAEVDLARYQKLLREDSIASQQVDTQRATVNQLEGTVSADRAAIGTANLNLNYTSIRAPVTGRAGIRQVDIGNYLTASDTVELSSSRFLIRSTSAFLFPKRRSETLEPAPRVASDFRSRCSIRTTII